jgi:hypothetical protein
MYETGLLGIVERLFEKRARKADVTANALGSPPGMRAVDAEAMKLGDERRCALETAFAHAADSLRSPRAGGWNFSRASMTHSACAKPSASDRLSMFEDTMRPVRPCTMTCQVSPRRTARMRWPR